MRQSEETRTLAGSGKTRPSQALNAKKIKAMKPDALGPYRVPDQRCKGLALRVATDGRKTWDLSFRLKGGAVRRMSLGGIEDVGLEAARTRANALTSAARLGRDLVKDEKAARDEAAREFTVEKLIEEYLKRRVRGRLRSATDIELRLKRTLTSIMKRKATEIRRRELRDLFDAVADAGRKGEAEKRRATVSTMFAWAVGQDICENNPTQGLTSFDDARKARERVLSSDEIVELWRWCETIPPKTADVLKLQLLLGARVTEVGMMHAAEFSSSDDGCMVWTLPPARSKNKVARTVPVVGMAKAIIGERLAERADLLFDRGSDVIGKYLRDHKRAFKSHDLRRTAASGMAEVDLSLEIIAAIVGHESGVRSTATLRKHYVHSEHLKRKTLALEAWDRRVREIVEGLKPAANVRPRAISGSARPVP